MTKLRTIGLLSVAVILIAAGVYGYWYFTVSVPRKNAAMAASTFITELKDNQLAEAYGLLTPDFQQKLPQGQFNSNTNKALPGYQQTTMAFKHLNVEGDNYTYMGSLAGVATVAAKKVTVRMEKNSGTWQVAAIRIDQ